MTAICCRLEQEARFGLQRLDGAAEGHEEGTGKENERKNDHKHNKGFFGSLHKSIWILDWVLCTYKQRNYEKNPLAQLSHNPLKTHSIDWRVHIIVHRLVCAFMPEGPVTESRQNDRHDHFDVTFAHTLNSQAQPFTTNRSETKAAVPKLYARICF